MKLKQFIFQQMEEKGNVLDGDVCRVFGANVLVRAEVYKGLWRRLSEDKQRFDEIIKDKENVLIKHAKRKYLIRHSNWEHNAWSRISRYYFMQLKKLGYEDLTSNIK